MKMKSPTHPVHRRGVLKSMLNPCIDTPSRTALGSLMRGYTPQGSKPSTGTRPKPRAHLVRVKSSGGLMTGIDGSLDRMIAHALVTGPQTSGVLSSLFGLSPNLTGR